MAALEGRTDVAAQLCGFSDSIYARKGVVRQVNEKRAYEHARSIAGKELGTSEFESLCSLGRAIHDEEAERLAFGMAGKSTLT